MEKNADPLMSYKKKRDFSVTPEPMGDDAKKTASLSFAVQKHDCAKYSLRPSPGA